MKVQTRNALRIRVWTLTVLSRALDLPVFARLTRGLTPEPRVESFEGETATRRVESAAVIARQATEMPDVRAGRIALIGASTGASLAFLLVARPMVVTLAVPPNDRYFPVDQAEALASTLPTARLTVTSALDHARPGASLRRLGEFRAFDGFVVRTLAGAAS